MSEKHTPGPLYVGAQNDALFIINQPPRPSNDYINPIREGLRVLAAIRGTGEEAIANARLYSAAPDLLAACRGIVDDECHCDEPGVSKPCVQCVLRAAIAKATRPVE